MYMEWKDEYSVSHSTLDFDHQMLINIINQLAFAVQNKQGKRVIGQTIESLVKYVETHFAREEDVMRAAKFPDLVSHQAKHREIEETVRDIFDLFKRSPKDLEAEKVLIFLKTWLIQHILRSDMKYAPYVAQMKAA